MWKNMSKILWLLQKSLSFYDDPFCSNKTKKLLRQPNTTAIESNDVRLGFIPDRDQREIFSRFRLSLVGLKIVTLHVNTYVLIRNIQRFTFKKKNT